VGILPVIHIGWNWLEGIRQVKKLLVHLCQGKQSRFNQATVQDE
jgi:hypothetical protein